MEGSMGTEFALNSGDYIMNSDDLDILTKEMLSVTNGSFGVTNSNGTQSGQFNSVGSYQINTQEPYLEIIEQPKARGLRFRYECEGRNAGSIPGESSSPSEKTFPTIQIHNHSGSAVVVVSCVTKESPAKPHPHALVGKDCGEGVCTVKTKKANLPLTFPGIGIQCSKKKDLEAALDKREQIRVDPFQTGFSHKKGHIDLTVVRLCFQAFLPDDKGKFTKILPPVVSKPIYDKKAINELNICRCSLSSGSATGGDEVFLFTDKVNKDDIQVHFFQEDADGVSWEAFGKFGSADVHKQVAIVFTTPPYQSTGITEPVHVLMELRRPSDGVTSESRTFTYIPADMEPTERKRKRKHVNEDIKKEFINSTNAPPANAKAQIRDHLRKKSQQEPVVKQEPVPTEPIPWEFGQQNVYQYTVEVPQGDQFSQQQYLLTGDDPNLPHMTGFLNDMPSGGNQEVDAMFNSGDLYGVGANEDVMSTDNMPEDLAVLHRQLRNING